MVIKLILDSPIQSPSADNIFTPVAMKDVRSSQYFPAHYWPCLAAWFPFHREGKVRMGQGYNL